MKEEAVKILIMQIVFFYDFQDRKHMQFVKENSLNCLCYSTMWEKLSFPGGYSGPAVPYLART